MLANVIELTNKNEKKKKTENEPAPFAKPYMGDSEDESV
jgi:hypothetical protein